MTEEIVNCDVGIITKTQCHLSSYTDKKYLYKIKSLLVEDILNLKFRIDNFYEISNGKICEHHKYVWLTHYSHLKRKCCDPFKNHETIIKTDLRILKLEICEIALEKILLKLKPGDKICKRCEALLKNKIDSVEYVRKLNSVDSVASSSNAELRRSERIKHVEQVSYSDVLPESQVSTDSTGTGHSNFFDYTPLSQEQKVNSVLNSLNMSCWKDYPFYKSGRTQDAENIVEGVCRNFAEQFSKVANINIIVPEPISHNILEDCSVFRGLLTNLQRKFENTESIFKKLEILALLPRDWNRREIGKHFNCTDYMYRKLSEFKEMDDFPDNVVAHVRKNYTKISSEMQQFIHEYYVNEANTYTCPGKRDFVTVLDADGRKIFVQKKLLLYTVHDLYLKFLDEYTGNEKPPSFSYFMSLKPVECIHAGDPGSHTICVCAEHQNVKLKLYALSRKLKYRDVLQGAVCNIDNEDCMTKKCNECQGQPGVLKKLECLVKELDIDLEKEQIQYKNWVESGSAAKLQNFQDNFDNFKNQLCRDINFLTIHHYIADTQKRFLNHCKSNLEANTCIILMDFSENYSFIIQQSVQAFYYNNSQATLHPFCIYYKTEKSNELLNVNYCVISDSKDHFAYTVNAFTAKLMNMIKERYNWIKSIIYFSDGAPQQYKNKNHLVNILHHEKDFGIKVQSYNFFATSHGKSPCDAIGGILKRQVMRHCIRSPPEGQITNAREMYEYGVKEIKTIRVLWVSNTEVKRYERHLRKRFSSVTTFPNTRQCHCYIPVEGISMIMKVTSFSVDQKTVDLNVN